MADPARYNVTKGMKDQLAEIASSVRFAEPPSKNVQYCNEIDWSKFDDIVYALKLCMYL
jgi:hypothetical protein